jgi:hypothetical protein
LSLPGFKGRRIVAEHMLEEAERARAAEGKPAHVRDIEQTGGATGGQVLGNHPPGIHEGHVPTGEVDHFGV